MALRSLWKSLPLSPLSRLTLNILPPKPSNLLSPTSTPLQIPRVDITFVSQWREDGLVNLEQKLSKGCREVVLSSRVCENGGVVVNVDFAEIIKSASKEEVKETSYGFGTTHTEPPPTWPTPGTPLSTSTLQPTTTIEPIEIEPIVKITVQVPEKIHLTSSTPYGNITVKGKLEGNTFLSTSSGSLFVEKLRGHDVTLQARRTEFEGSGVVYASKLVEAETAVLKVNCGGRVRVKMINGRNVHVSVDEDEVVEGVETLKTTQIKTIHGDDDTGALVDIGSLYSNHPTNPATIIAHRPKTKTSENLLNPQDQSNIRIKSTHGRINVVTNSTKHSKDVMNEYNQRVPIVDLGGVSGECNINITSPKIKKINRQRFLAAKVHFDSVYPAGWSVINCDSGDVEITVDRKIESDIRLLSTDQTFGLFQKSFINGEISHSDFVDFSKEPTRGQLDIVNVQSKSFQVVEYISTDLVHYVAGKVFNGTDEPDSRFDRKNNGFGSGGGGGGGGGKIDIERAQQQALNNFGGSNTNSNENSDVVVSREEDANISMITAGTGLDGTIDLDTLNWMGAIQRRYNVQERDQ